MSLFSEIKNITGDRKELRKFGFSFGCAMLVLGSLLLWRGKPIFPVPYCLSGFCLFFALVNPVILMPLQKTLMAVMLIIMWTITNAALCCAYFAVFTPMSLAGKILRKEFLEEAIDKKRKT